jgi:ferredoxin--NADP+ reductase
MLHKIIKKVHLSDEVVSLDVKAPVIAEKARAGQFVVIRAFETGERIPLTIADSYPDSGIIKLGALKVGKTTYKLSEMEEGDSIIDIVGPLGTPSEIENYGTVVVVGGGVGIAPIYPIVRALKIAGNNVVTIIGAKNKAGLIFIDELKEFSDDFHICTDDGSHGYKGFVSCFLSDFLNENSKKVNRVIAIGPVLMMKAVCDVTKPLGIKTIVSLNPVMVDGTGMCGSCRVEIAGETKFGCVDGPEFDGHLINFDLLQQRLGVYVKEEKEALELWKKTRK